MEIKDFKKLIIEHRKPDEDRVMRTIDNIQDRLHDKIAFQPFNSEWVQNTDVYANELERDTFLEAIQKVLKDKGSAMVATKYDFDGDSRIKFHVRQEIVDEV